MSHLTPTPIGTRAVRLIAAGAAGLLLAAAPAGAALADPKPFPGEEVTLSCAGQTYDIVLTRSNGEWTPAFDTASNRVFQPVGFVETHYSVRILDGPMGGYEDSGTEPGMGKKGLRKGQDVVECTFQSAFSGYDEEAKGNVEGSWGGTVLAVIHG